MLLLILGMPLMQMHAAAGVVAALAGDDVAAEGLSEIPDSSALDAKVPTLWSGLLKRHDGKPAPGAVTLAVRPSAEDIDRALTSGAPMPATVPLAKQRVGADGRFTLKGDLPPNLPAGYVKDGWVNVLLVATDGQEIRLATDSMFRDPEPLTGKSRWLTSPASRLQREAFAKESRAGTSANAETGRASLIERLEADLTDSQERPNEIQFDKPPSGSASPVSEAAVGPGAPYVGCNVNQVVDRTAAFQSIADIDQAGGWRAKVIYSNTRNTSFEVGYSASGNSWSVAGSSLVSQNASVEFGLTFPPEPVPNRSYTSMLMELNYDKIQWRCASQSNPGPYYPYTSEPVAWTGNTRNLGTPTINCNPNYLSEIGTDFFFRKQGGSGATYSASGSAFGFYGKASVGYATNLEYTIENMTGTNAQVCGESGNPLFDHTRVRPK